MPKYIPIAMKHLRCEPQRHYTEDSYYKDSKNNLFGVVSTCRPCKLIYSSYNETVDVNAVSIRKCARDTHLPGSFKGELQQATETTKQNYCRQQETIAHVNKA